VFEAKFEGELVAVKFIFECRSYEAEIKASFQRELQQLQMLHHPNLVALLGAGQWDDERLFLIMEFCDGGSLDGVLRDTGVPLVWETALQCATQVAQGMAFLHSKQRIHRDLKSPNILVSGDWLLKVCTLFLPLLSLIVELMGQIADFGAAKRVVQASGYSRPSITAGSAVGSLEWLPP
jgi:serine/threonine protein kinase